MLLCNCFPLKDHLSSSGNQPPPSSWYQSFFTTSTTHIYRFHMHTFSTLIDDRNGKLTSLCDCIQRLPFAFSFLDISSDYRVIPSPNNIIHQGDERHSSEILQRAHFRTLTLISPLFSSSLCSSLCWPRTLALCPGTERSISSPWLSVRVC